MCTACQYWWISWILLFKVVAMIAGVADVLCQFLHNSLLWSWWTIYMLICVGTMELARHDYQLSVQSKKTTMNSMLLLLLLWISTNNDSCVTHGLISLLQYAAQEGHQFLIIFVEDVNTFDKLCSQVAYYNYCIIIHT